MVTTAEAVATTTATEAVAVVLMETTTVSNVTLVESMDSPPDLPTTIGRPIPSLLYGLCVL